MASLRLSIDYGHGNLHWFDELPYEDKVSILAFERIRVAELKKLNKPPPGPPRGGRG